MKNYPEIYRKILSKNFDDKNDTFTSDAVVDLKSGELIEKIVGKEMASKIT